MTDTSARGIRIGSLLAAIAAVTLCSAVPARAQATGGNCDRACLSGVMDTYLKAMAAHTPEKVPLAAGATIVENIKPITLDASRWRGVTGIKSTASFPDPQTGQIVKARC